MVNLNRLLKVGTAIAGLTFLVSSINNARCSTIIRQSHEYQEHLAVERGVPSALQYRTFIDGLGLRDNAGFQQLQDLYDFYEGRATTNTLIAFPFIFYWITRLDLK